MDVLQLRLRNKAPARVEPLAVLPAFWALEGKRVLIAGGTDAARWKAELLAACGDCVEVYAEAFTGTFQALFAHAPDHPAACVTPHNRRRAPCDLPGAALAISDCEEDAQGRARGRRSRQHHRQAAVPPVLVRLIVNRSPVVTTISTEGAAPILAQAIRRKIEALLPRSLKAWAALAQSLRETVSRRLKPGAQRRVFWERFSDRFFSTLDTPEEGVGGALLDDADGSRQPPPQAA